MEITWQHGPRSTIGRVLQPCGSHDGMGRCEECFGHEVHDSRPDTEGGAGGRPPRLACFGYELVELVLNNVHVKREPNADQRR